MVIAAQHKNIQNVELIILLFIALIVFVVVFIAKSFKSAPDAPQTASNQTHEELIQNADYLMSLMEVKRQAEERGDSDTVNAVLNMTYNGTMPMQKPDGSYTCIYNPLWDFNLAGVNYRKNIRDYVGVFEGYLQPETDNEYDPDAIAVYHADGHHLGYIPQNCTDDIRDLELPFPIAIFGEIEEGYDYEENRNYFKGTVYLEIPDPNATHPYDPHTI